MKNLVLTASQKRRKRYTPREVILTRGICFDVSCIGLDIDWNLYKCNQNQTDIGRLSELHRQSLCASWRLFVVLSVQVFTVWLPQNPRYIYGLSSSCSDLLIWYISLHIVIKFWSQHQNTGETSVTGVRINLSRCKNDVLRGHIHKLHRKIPESGLLCRWRQCEVRESNT
jgi:hypothetical protein